MTNKTKTIEALRNLEQSNKVASALFTSWGNRKRPRYHVTIHGIQQRMTKEGFNFSAKEYSDVLVELSKLGFGKLETDKKGEILALDGLDVTITSIGLVACNKENELEKFRKRNKFKHLVPIPASIRNITEAAETLADAPVEKRAENRPVISAGLAVNLSLMVNEKAVNIPLPASLTSDEIALIISHFQDRRSA